MAEWIIDEHHRGVRSGWWGWQPLSRSGPFVQSYSEYQTGPLYHDNEHVPARDPLRVVQ